MKIPELKIENYRRLLPYIFLSIVTVAALYPLWLGKFYGTGDMRDVFIPLESFYRTAQMSGYLPTWHPDIAWGFPVMASGQLGFWYPPLLLLRFLPLWIYLPLLLLLHVVASGIGFYVWLKRQSYSAPAAFFGASSFMLSAWLWQHLTHLNIFLGIAWLPWQLLAAHYFGTASAATSRTIISLGVLVALPFLIGQFQVPLMMAALTMVYYLWLRHQQGALNLKSVLLVISTVFLVVGLSAVQLLPTAELALQSSRGVAGDFSLERANQHSWPLYHAPTLLFPRFFGNDDTYWGKRLEIEYGFFIGTLPLLAALWAIKFRWQATSFWLAVAAISFLLALGDFSPFRLFFLEPSLWIFSAPARWLLLTTTALAVLAAAGFDQAAKSWRLFRKYLLTVVLVLLVLVGLFNIFFLLSVESLPYILSSLSPFAIQPGVDLSAPYYHEKIEQLAQSLRGSSVSFKSLFTYLPFAVLLISVCSSTWRPWALVAVTCTELVIVAATTSPTVSWHTLLEPPASAAALPIRVINREVRLLSLRTGGDTGAYFTNPASRANDQTREQQRQLLVPLLHSQFGLGGVEWPASLDLKWSAGALSAIHEVVRADSPNLEQLAEFNIGAVLTESGKEFSDIKAQSSTALVNTYEIAAKPRAELLAQGQSIPYRATSPTSLEFTVTTAQPDTLLIRDTWYPGWHAEVEGQGQTVERAGIFRSIFVPAGHHVVKLYYQPWWLPIGLLVSSLTALIAIYVWRKSVVLG